MPSRTPGRSRSSLPGGLPAWPRRQ
ncbi:MAG: hypothetical protein JRN56_04090 [Nitrososphaerota archaeon]|nr:hypothetical protein [Nitrososphaerota archaeon]MDG6937266.1 hypothetical protein [Nitrososphaerota archaeon]MDG6961374.1 hypothetical protein [Nitrososphaerota archaeon]MDG6962808.1 hypothetical protein [Nitrososphaerota archaeon]MDG6984855.1 hypothetical protein [Nitrososphaerota archaeon]